MTAAPLMRATSIDLDDREMPATVAVVMSWPVWDRLCRDHRALRSVAVQDSAGLWRDRFPIEWVARNADWYRTPEDDIVREIRSCLASLCNRFWPGGVLEAVAAVVVDQ
jgi:hypothetical protein